MSGRRYTKGALWGAVVVLGLLCYLAAIGVRVVTEGLVTVACLVVLVGGGNWLSGRGGRTRPAGPSTPAAGSGGEMACPMAAWVPTAPSPHAEVPAGQPEDARRGAPEGST